ncbi:hypothetical protein [Paraburkholderia sp.]|uniref:hypothetical protein n=1 Tax=Paraburkholderia sp. TaxID=1926495 RepID=UPI0039E70EC2
MARENIIRFVDRQSGMFEATRQTKWVVTPGCPLKPEDLNFTSRDERGRFVWWDVVPPKTDYWHAHQVLGRAYAFELLDLMNNPNSEYPEHIVAYITLAMSRWAQRVSACASEGTISGFFEVLSEFMGKGTVTR